jgi:hypothetical protein
MVEPLETLNYLIHREGEERLRAAEAACDRSRRAHVALAGLFRDRIEARRAAVTGAAGDAATVAARARAARTSSR